MKLKRTVFLLTVVVALGLLLGASAASGAVPEPATLISPSGTITDNTPTYTWNAVANSTWYYLWVNDSTQDKKILKWYPADDAGCGGGTGECSVTPETVLAGGAAEWWIQTWNIDGDGDWSAGLSFTVAQELKVEVDETGTNATAIRNLEFNGALYDVTFRYGTVTGIWGDEAFDFNQPNVAGDASVAVNDALNTVPDIVTVGPRSSENYDIPYERSGIVVSVYANGYAEAGSWGDIGIFPNFTFEELSYAKFTQVESIIVPAAPVPKTGQTESVLPGDDGDLQIGVTWPDLRFTDNGDGTVTDNLTGLIWLQSTNCFPSRVWADALQASNDLADGQCGLVDGSLPGAWRLPNIREILSLIDYGNIAPALPSGHPFVGVTSSYFWTSTATTDSGGRAAWIVDVWFGTVNALFTADRNADLWPVRGGND